MSNNITARTIVDLLREQHEGRNDVFIAEACVGNLGRRRLDAWAVKRSWANPRYDGYEIKISRGDWLGDGKYQDYADYCTHFWLVSVKDVIKLNEVPAFAGLKWVTSTGKLYTKKKAPPRKVAEPWDMLFSAFINRMVVRASNHAEFEKTHNVEYWKRYLADKQERYEVGAAVRQRLRKDQVKYIEGIERENHRLKYEAERIHKIEDRLSEAGIDVSQWGVWREAEQDFLRKQFAGKFDSIIQNLQDMKEMVDSEKEVECNAQQ